jgi:hypothetical protein
MYTPALLAYAITTVVWFLLLVSGIKRGYRRQITVFNSPRDFAVTALLFVMAGVGCIPLGLDPLYKLIGQILTGAVACFWLRAAYRTNPRLHNLGLVVLTKVSLVVIAGLCFAIVITSTARVLAPKRSLLRQVMNVVTVGIGLYAGYRYIRMISQLMPGAHPLKSIPPTFGVWEKLMTST